MAALSAEERELATRFASGEASLEGWLGALPEVPAFYDAREARCPTIEAALRILATQSGGEAEYAAHAFFSGKSLYIVDLEGAFGLNTYPRRARALAKKRIFVTILSIFAPSGGSSHYAPFNLLASAHERCDHYCEVSLRLGCWRCFELQHAADNAAERCAAHETHYLDLLLDELVPDIRAMVAEMCNAYTGSPCTTAAVRRLVSSRLAAGRLAVDKPPAYFAGTSVTAELLAYNGYLCPFSRECQWTSREARYCFDRFGCELRGGGRLEARHLTAAAARAGLPATHPGSRARLALPRTEKEAVRLVERASAGDNSRLLERHIRQLLAARPSALTAAAPSTTAAAFNKWYEEALPTEFPDGTTHERWQVHLPVAVVAAPVVAHGDVFMYLACKILQWIRSSFRLVSEAVEAWALYACLLVDDESVRRQAAALAHLKRFFDGFANSNDLLARASRADLRDLTGGKCRCYTRGNGRMLLILLMRARLCGPGAWPRAT